MNNPKFLSMSDKELVAHIAMLVNSIVLHNDPAEANLLEAATELDLRRNRS